MAEYIAAGANRHPMTADWLRKTLAYGSDRNIAMWNPQVSHLKCLVVCLVGVVSTG